MTETNALFNAVKELHQAGCCVIPLAERSKRPILASWAEYQKRRPDASERFEWFGDHPELNIGVVCGWVSGDGDGRSLVVLDFDSPESYREFGKAHLEIVNHTWIAKTARGYHVYLRTSGKVQTTKIAGGDLKAEGSYVVAPPSIHPDTGQPYTWVNKPNEIAVVDDLAVLIQVKTAETKGPAPAIPEKIQAGQRNTTLTSLAGSMRRRGASAAEILAALQVANRERCDPPLPDAEVERIAQSVGRYTPRETAERKGASERADKPVIRVAKGILHVLATAGEDALIAGGAPIYARGDVLQRPVLDEVDAADGRRTQVAHLATITPECLIDYLSQFASWERYDGRVDDFVPCDPPLLVARIILSRAGGWRVPKIAGVITTPTLRSDGTILAEPGLDPKTRLLLLSPPLMPPIPAHPARRDALAALAILEALLTEFPFADEASHAVAMSALISPVVRPALGAVPLHAASSPEAGTGKSYLFDLAAAIATGRWCPVIAAGDCGRGELEKRLGAAALAATSILSVDNINGILQSDVLCQLIERPLVEVRILGQSRNVTIESRMILFATGNNLLISGDLARRTIRCLLDARAERPEQRQFAFDPFRMITKDRGRYVAAVLTIVRAYSEAGQPGRLPVLVSFQGWSDLVRSALVWLGCADPVETMESIREDDPGLAELHAVVDAWASTAPNQELSTASLASLALDGDGKPNGTALSEALMGVAERRGTIDTRKLAYWLRGHRGRIAGNWCIERRGRAWCLAPVCR